VFTNWIRRPRSMNLLLRSSLIACLCAPVSTAQSIPTPRPAEVLSPAEAKALEAVSDPSLDALRAGQVQEKTSLREEERATLLAAEAKSPGLADMRAGGDTVEVLLIIVLVLLILVLI
jgi:hypothetical protein